MGVSVETSALASAARLWTSRFWEMKRSEPARVSLSLAEADWISHGSKTASVNPASKHSPNVFGLFATLRPSTADDKGQIQRDLKSIPRIAPRRDGRLADWGLPDWSLSNRHLAELSLLIDGLRARDVGSASGSHHGKRCTRYNHNFHHGTFPLSWKKQGSDLPSVSLRHAVSMNVGIRLQCGRWDTFEG